MTEVIGVRFRTAGKIYYFDPKDIHFTRGEHAIVETARGIEYGFVVMGNRETEDAKIVQPLKEVIRKANAEDDQRHLENEAKEKEAYKVCQEKIRKHNLEMKLIDVEYTFDSSKVLFYFTADGRVDFRSLVKDLAAIFRTRIELRQVGVRDAGRLWYLRPSALLSYLPVRLCTGVDPHGEGAGTQSEPDEYFRCLWTSDVLPQERGGCLRVPERTSSVRR